MSSTFRRFDIFWLLLSIIALAVSGLYSVSVSMMRVPAIYNIFHLPDFFKISLVIHVTLSINIFFMLFGIYHMQIFLKKSLLTQFLKYCSGFFIFLIIISGFIPHSSAIIINYIPLIDHWFFYIGIFAFFLVFWIFSLFTVIKIIKEKWLLVKTDLQHHFLFSISVTSMIAFLCLILSYLVNIKYITNLRDFHFEEFSWGIGHILQFVFVEIGFLSLLKNLSIFNKFFDLEKYPKWLNKFLFIKILIVGIAPFFYFHSQTYQIFTIHMRYGVAIFIIPILFLFLKNLKGKIKENFFHYSIIGFILYFVVNLYGGILGFAIREINVVVPAHYHGSLISITILLMSFFYGAIKNIGKKIDLTVFSLTMRRLIFFQLVGYCIGNMMHITGLMIMGGYGALRKTPGDIPINIFFGKNIFIIGSLLSVLCGLLFICIAAISIKKVCRK
jgi:hypothetical protein